jgi:tetratricopeptide (TPR) repeat protein
MGKMTYGLLLGASLVASLAHADTRLDEARSRLQSGATLYDENDFRGALVEFQRAYELAPSYKILFNIALVEMALQDHAGALKAYTRYVKEGGPDITAARLAQVNADIERLKGRVGFLVIQTASSAQVLIDDAHVGYAPLPCGRVDRLDGVGKEARPQLGQRHPRRSRSPLEQPAEPSLQVSQAVGQRCLRDAETLRRRADVRRPGHGDEGFQLIDGHSYAPLDRRRQRNLRWVPTDRTPLAADRPCSSGPS